MSALRKLTIKQSFQGFWDGFAKGLSATDDAFDAPVTGVKVGLTDGLKLDVEAIRSDVGRAKAKLTREIEQSARAAKAG